MKCHIKLNVEHLLYSHFCEASRVIFLIPKLPIYQNILTPKIPNGRIPVTKTTQHDFVS